MTEGTSPPGTGGEPDSGCDAAAGGGDARAPTRGDRLLVVGFAAWVALLVVAAFAQLTDNRFLLDLFDLRRWFTR